MVPIVETAEQRPSRQLCTLNYQLQKKILPTVNRKDFLEKCIKFADEGRFYVYFTGMDASLTKLEVEQGGLPSLGYREKPADSDRCYTTLGVQRLERRPSDGKIIYTMLLQSDLKIPMGLGFLVKSQLPKSMKDWS